MSELAPLADEAVRGVKSLCVLLGCTHRTLYALAARPVDPLRLWSAAHDPTPWQLRSRLVAFRRRWRTPEDPALVSSRLLGWMRIAGALPGPRGGRMSLATARRLAEREVDPLPVHRTREGKPYAYREALLDWLDWQTRRHGESRLVTARKSRKGCEAEGIQKPPARTRENPESTVQKIRQEGSKVRTQKVKRAA